MGDFDVFDTETCVITRKTPTNDGTGSKTISTIYSGACDFQDGNPGLYVSPSGVVDQSDAVLFIDPASDGTLPDAQLGDECVVTIVAGGVTSVKQFTVVLASPWYSPIVNLELTLKRGGLPVKPKH